MLVGELESRVEVRIRVARIIVRRARLRLRLGYRVAIRIHRAAARGFFLAVRREQIRVFLVGFREDLEVLDLLELFFVVLGGRGRGRCGLGIRGRRIR